MKSLKGTRTLTNLMIAFAGESQARNRYVFYASKARKDGYKQIEAIFTETAANEKEHAERFYDLMLDGLDGMLPAEVEITGGFPVAKGETLANLEAAADGEKFEWSELYLESEKVAREEGFELIAEAFKHIAMVEAKHEYRYRKLAENIKNGLVFKREQVTRWKCSNCGYVHEGTSAPDKCPACLHTRDYYELYVEAY